MGEITRVCLWSHCVHYETASPQNSIHHLSSISPTVIGRRWWYLSAKPQRQSGAQESLKRLGTQQLQQWSQVPLVKYSINIYKTNFRPSHGALPWMLSSLMDLWKLHEKLCLFIMIIQVRLLCLLDLEYCRFGSIALLFWLEILIDPVAIAKVPCRSSLSDDHSYPAACYDDHTCPSSGDWLLPFSLCHHRLHWNQ